MLTLENKQAIVADVSKVASQAQSLVAAEYRGLTVEEMTEFRAQARSSGVYVRVVKNTLARRAFADTGFECVAESLAGPLVLAFSMEEPGSAARVVRGFSKSNEKLDVKVVAISGTQLDVGDLERLAEMPTRDEAIAQLMAMMKAPVEKFVRTLAAPNTKLVRTVLAVKEQKDAA